MGIKPEQIFPKNFCISIGIFPADRIKTLVLSLFLSNF